MQITLPKFSVILQKSAGFLTILAGILFVAGNIIASQIPGQLFGLISEGDKKALVYFFQQARKLPQFSTLYPEIKEIYLSLENEILKEERQQQQVINKLEGLLKKNPHSRDVLYALSLLYKRQGQGEKALEYLEKARAIDPAVEQLVKLN